MKRLAFAAAVLSSAVSFGSAWAQQKAAEFPERPLRYIVPFPPGGATDIVARIVAHALIQELGQQVVIDNRGGAGGTIGAEIAARASADGYTVFACNIASLAISPALYRKLGYNVGDFAPIGLIGSNPNVLVVHPSVPAKTVDEFTTLARTRPTKMNYGSPGVGTSPQLSMELFKMTAKVDIVHIAYKGAGPMLGDLIGGHLQTAFATLPSVLTFMRIGKLRGLAVTSRARSPDVPELPTLIESGMPKFDVVSWQGLCAPTGTPQPVLAHLQKALTAAMKQPETRRRLSEQGIVVDALSAEDFAAYIRAEHTKWANLVKAAGIQPQ